MPTSQGSPRPHLLVCPVPQLYTQQLEEERKKQEKTLKKCHPCHIYAPDPLVAVVAISAGGFAGFGCVLAIARGEVASQLLKAPTFGLGGAVCANRSIILHVLTPAFPYGRTSFASCAPPFSVHVFGK